MSTLKRPHLSKVVMTRARPSRKAPWTLSNQIRPVLPPLALSWAESNVHCATDNHTWAKTKPLGTDHYRAP